MPTSAGRTQRKGHWTKGRAPLQCGLRVQRRQRCQGNRAGLGRTPWSSDRQGHVPRWGGRADSLKLRSPEGGPEGRSRRQPKAGPQEECSETTRPGAQGGAGGERCPLGPAWPRDRPPWGSFPRGFSALQLHQHPDLGMECPMGTLVPKPRGAPGNGGGDRAAGLVPSGPALSLRDLLMPAKVGCWGRASTLRE